MLFLLIGQRILRDRKPNARLQSIKTPIIFFYHIEGDIRNKTTLLRKGEKTSTIPYKNNESSFKKHYQFQPGVSLQIARQDLDRDVVKRVLPVMEVISSTKCIFLGPVGSLRLFRKYYFLTYFCNTIQKKLLPR